MSPDDPEGGVFFEKKNLKSSNLGKIDRVLGVVRMMGWHDA